MKWLSIGKRGAALGSWIVGVLFLWGALANIWPKLFQISQEPPAGFFKHVLHSFFSYAWNPALIWLAAPVAVAWFGWLVVIIFQRLESVATEAQAWRRDRETEIAAYLKAGSTKIDGKLTDFVSASDAALNRYHQEHEARLSELEKYKQLEWSYQDRGETLTWSQISSLSAVHLNRLKTEHPRVWEAFQQEMFKRQSILRPGWTWHDIKTDHLWTFDEIATLPLYEREQLQKNNPTLWQSYSEEAQKRFGIAVATPQAPESVGKGGMGAVTVEILNLVENQEVSYEEMVKGYVDPPDTQGLVEVRIFDPATQQWNPAGSSGRSDGEWWATCTFGIKGAAAGVYNVVALLLSYSVAGALHKLPEGVVKSKVIKVRRTK